MHLCTLLLPIVNLEIVIYAPWPMWRLVYSSNPSEGRLDFPRVVPRAQPEGQPEEKSDPLKLGLEEYHSFKFSTSNLDSYRGTKKK